ncbi:MAG: FAD-dependent oxidoreductase [Patescibacteria group bacterium]|jgi:thioredoxin-disulfide reductase|nr:FAD-dependent oxidoreductase [Patescibacteria group bacterium]
MYDLIIIGLGPAALTAAIYAGRREMSVLVIGKELGGQLVWADVIENYPGAPEIKSFELVNNMRKQAEDAGAKIKSDEINLINKKEDGNFELQSNKTTYNAKAVIIATGLSPRRLAIPGEVEFNSKGVSYCANCDGPFYKDKTVAVIGGGNSALDAAEVLSKIAKKVYLIHHKDTFKAFEALKKEIKERENIEIMVNTEVSEIKGSDNVKKIEIHNLANNSKKSIDIDGIFIEIGRIASTDLFSELVVRNKKDQIVIDEKGKTKTPGLYAAGDVTQCEVKQITVATGQATIAALDAYNYIKEK